MTEGLRCVHGGNDDGPALAGRGRNSRNARTEEIPLGHDGRMIRMAARARKRDPALRDDDKMLIRLGDLA